MALGQKLKSVPTGKSIWNPRRSHEMSRKGASDAETDSQEALNGALGPLLSTCSRCVGSANTSLRVTRTPQLTPSASPIESFPRSWLDTSGV